MRTELPPLPSATQPDEAGEVALEQVIQDIDRRLKALESAMQQMTVNNATRHVMWNGAVMDSTTIHATGGGGLRRSYSPSLGDMAGDLNQALNTTHRRLFCG